MERKRRVFVCKVVSSRDLRLSVLHFIVVDLSLWQMRCVWEGRVLGGTGRSVDVHYTHRFTATQLLLMYWFPLH